MAESKAREAAEQVEQQLIEHRTTYEAHAVHLEAKLEDGCHAAAVGLHTAAEVAATRVATDHVERHKVDTAQQIDQVHRDIHAFCLDVLGKSGGPNTAGALDWHAAISALSDRLTAALCEVELRAADAVSQAESRVISETER